MSGHSKMYYKKFQYALSRIKFTKRQQFVFITVVLTAGLLMTQLAWEDSRYPMVLFLSLATYGLAAWGLSDDLKGIEWVSLLILPTLYTAGVSLFYYLLPVRWLTRLPVAVGYAVGLYALLLTENIYNVAVNRTIALLRAAHSVGFLITLVTFFLLMQSLVAFAYPWYIQLPLAIVLTGALVFQTLWSVELEEEVSESVFYLTMVITTILSMFLWVLSFWPLNKTLLVLLLTTIFYSLAGMGQQFISLRLYKKTIIEYLSVLFIVMVIIVSSANWRAGV